MAFGLTRAEFYSTPIEEPVSSRRIQRARLVITGLAADVDLDLGDNGGTFWTAVTGSSPGDEALQAMKDIATKAEQLSLVASEELIDRQEVAATSGATEYTIAVQDKRPNIGFHAASAPTSYQVILEWELKEGQIPVEGAFTA